MLRKLLNKLSLSKGIVIRNSELPTREKDALITICDFTGGVKHWLILCAYIEVVNGRYMFLKRAMQRHHLLSCSNRKSTIFTNSICYKAKSTQYDKLWHSGNETLPHWYYIFVPKILIFVKENSNQSIRYSRQMLSKGRESREKSCLK